MYNMGETGDKGYSGNTGKPGKSYFLNTYAEKCYDEIINECETFLINNKIQNNRNYNNNEPQLKNMYLKNKIKDICNSIQFNNFLEPN